LIYEDVKVEVPFDITVTCELVKSQAKEFLLSILIQQVSYAVYQRIEFDLTRSIPEKGEISSN